MKRPSLLIIFLSVFIDLIGFGIVMPLLPIYGKQFGANGLEIGLIIASFSVMQFLFAPAWGRLSDRIGRRPVILVSNAGWNIPQPVEAIRDEDWDALVELNVTSSMVLSRALAPGMKGRRWGRIIYISSVMALASTGDRVAYSNVMGTYAEYAAVPAWAEMPACLRNSVVRAARARATRRKRPTTKSCRPCCVG